MRRGRSPPHRQIRTGDDRSPLPCRRGRASTVEPGSRSRDRRGCARRGDPWVGPGAAARRRRRDRQDDVAPARPSRWPRRDQHHDALGRVLRRRGHGGPLAMGHPAQRPRPGGPGCGALAAPAAVPTPAPPPRGGAGLGVRNGARRPRTGHHRTPGAPRARRPALGRRGHPAPARRGRRPRAGVARTRRRRLSRHRHRGRLAAHPARWTRRAGDLVRPRPARRRHVAHAPSRSGARGRPGRPGGRPDRRQSLPHRTDRPAAGRGPGGPRPRLLPRRRT